ncbi:MAG: twin-arginine translocase TatA/TatE family subunit [Actinobacteria bacterium]|nr:twin-arginine translocase TatA/TatE family subunit [Actinomycetota bacterium]MBU4218712.1 twin-arginine translocase TatA/TatE family subunit [Actinomycetota bacterium]MBU4359441.1 twin-arginine translocase TatA/TatE family subunit [Actinomycetota bacterium]MBU4391312.1 twin-arginine translocase TatA/TatE family subunit [Actinomycetota bacterium]MBU4402868.1 twin-arginine translocase TatA/TatE family subunit [Actinomycetota bacterium]
MFGLGPVELIIIIVVVIVLFIPTLLPKIIRSVTETIGAIRQSESSEDDDSGE